MMSSKSICALVAAALVVACCISCGSQSSPPQATANKPSSSLTVPQPSTPTTDQLGSIATDPNVQSTGDFGGMLFLTDDKSFFDRWDGPNPPALKSATAARRGQPLYTVLIFRGPKVTSEGTINVTCDLTIRKPDGSVYADHPGMVAAFGKANPVAENLYLARNLVGIEIEPKDPAGTYSVEAKLTDRAGNKTTHLLEKFTVKD